MYVIIRNIIYILGGLVLILLSQFKIKKNNNSFSQKYSFILTVIGVLFIIGFGTSLFINLFSKQKVPDLNWIEKENGVYYSVIDDNKVFFISVFDDGNTNIDEVFINDIEQNLKNDGYSSKKVNISLNEKKKLLPYISSFKKYLTIKDAELFIINSYMNDQDIWQIAYFCRITTDSKKSIIIKDIAVQGVKKS